ncbi:hypothetical protein I350_08233 [Cryptococcus amylolentus CBS 6273]|uniref:Major facilitator superfamily (MFS) profile domain-containing protein n=1 Tax=Cryptococcus amylolentus CBS 6273 TaxID=1296118 RepID=A0A1E3J5V7_9TREE|nr:hypothetical protein I350_08233 [Cryptococcus amylolentus CBS 6273]
MSLLFKAQDGGAIDPTAHLDPHTGAVVEKKTKEERWLVARLDAILLVYLCISQVIKYLDQQNISAAYVSGMKEELNLYGNEYNYFTTWFSVGYAVFLIPSQIIITHVRPSWWLPALETCWGVLTLATCKVTNYKQVYVLRAFTGAFEATCYPGAIMLLMSWYTPRELALRIGFYQSCQSSTTKLAGALQAAIYNSMDGLHGMSGWRWMFLCMIHSHPRFPVQAQVRPFPPSSTPRSLASSSPWAFWLRPRHIDQAMDRVARFRRADNKKFTLGSVKKAILNPAGTLANFNLWLKSLKNDDGTARWSVAAVNAIPIGGGAVSVVMIWFWGFFSDFFETRWIPIAAQGVIGLIPSIIMSIWTVSDNAKYFSYFACYLSLATSPPIWAWLSDLNPFDAEQRAFILGSAIALYYAFSAWSGPLIWPASEAPHYAHGWQVMIALWALVVILACTLRYIELKHIRPQNVQKAEARIAVREAEENQEDDDKKEPVRHQVRSVASRV